MPALLSILARRVPPPLHPSLEAHWARYLDACRAASTPAVTNPDLLPTLGRVWAASPFVAESCIIDPLMLGDLLDSGDLFRTYGLRDHTRQLALDLARCHDEATLMAMLRRRRRREMVRIAWRDLGGWSDLGTTLRETSWFAEAVIDGALARLASWQPASQQPRHPDGRRMSLAIIGMGKLGAWELNFSSDVDLIYAHADGPSGPADPGASLAALGRQLLHVLDHISADGFVFRVDLRLRPYGEAGPLVMSLAQMEDYYQRQGREWERYAMIKARPVGGDRRAGARLLARLRPFMYRKYLDYGVFESLREMKRTIDREAARRDLEDDIKRGPGGIREIEFIGQTFQLIRGGREPALRDQRLLVILRRLAEARHLSERTSEELAESYRFLRRLENRLQMFGDAQTHRLPTDSVGRMRLAWTMGLEGTAAFEEALAGHRDRVRRHFNDIFLVENNAAEAGRTGPDFEAVWEVIASLPTRLEDARPILREVGGAEALPDFGEEGWRRLRILRDSYLYRSLSSPGRRRMDRLMPLLLQAVAETPRPDLTLPRVLEFIEHIARRTAYLALLADRPVVLGQMVSLCAASPWIARMLGEQPLLLDELIDPARLTRPLAREALGRDLRGRLDAAGDDLEQQMEALRQFKQASVLRVAAADIRGVLPLMVVSDHLTDIAEACLVAVLQLAADQSIQADGRARSAIDRGFAIVAYGKLGGIELGYGSDLDLVFLHGEGPAGATFIRLGQRINHMLSAHTPAGVLYPVDLRLRPSGASGLLVSAIDAFEAYQREQAWTWEHQALVRARIVAAIGDPRLIDRFERLREDVLGHPRDPVTLARETAAMRDRMRRERGRHWGHHRDSRFDLKQGRGGIADIEFIVQHEVLRWAGRYPALRRWTDNMRLLETLRETGLLSPGDAETLMDAYRRFRAETHRLSLQEAAAPLVPGSTFAALRDRVEDIWRARVEAPAEAGSEG